MDTGRHIAHLLLRHSCVVVPGFGGFIVDKNPASVHPVTHHISPPLHEIVFNPAIKHNDGLLISYIAAIANISYDSAAKQLEATVDGFRKTLNSGEMLEIGNLGTLGFEEGRLLFRQNRSHVFHPADFGLTHIVSPAIIREGLERRLARVASAGPKTNKAGTRRLIGRRIALMSIPAAAMVVWAVISAGSVEEIGKSYSAIFSILGSGSPTETTISGSGRSLRLFEGRDHTNDLREVFARDSAEKTIVPVMPDNGLNNSSGVCRYYIIGSCNRLKELADNYVKRLKASGYASSGVLSPGESGLYKVYIGCTADEDEARLLLKKIQKDENPDAWILKK